MFSNTNHAPKKPKQTEFDKAVTQTLEEFIRLIGFMLQGLFVSIRYGTFPYLRMSTCVAIIFFCLKYGLDGYVWLFLGEAQWYPSASWYPPYFYFCISSPLLIWMIYQAMDKKSLENKVTSIFLTAGLKVGTDKTPKPIFDISLGEGVRSMRIKRNSFPIETFHKAKPFFESGMNVYVDQISENRKKGTVDIIYSSTPIPSIVKYYNSAHSETCFQLGQTRIRDIFGDLRETPHLLVAGQTGGGKSNFIRGLITSLYLNNEKMDFVLVDLKGGLEFQVFENMKRIRVIPSIERAVKELKELQTELSRRMKLLREKNVKDIEALQDVLGTERLGRKLVVIDEAAEIFLGGHHATTSELNLARKSISQIARQGRAVGVHLAIATQRPDAKAVDPQVKTNLTGIVCFQMPNNISSMTVIDTGRATHLPDIPGRAIWKSGGKITELQTPYFPIEQTKEIIAPFKLKKLQSPHSRKPESIQNFDLEV